MQSTSSAGRPAFRRGGFVASPVVADTSPSSSSSTVLSVASTCLTRPAGTSSFGSAARRTSVAVDASIELAAPRRGDRARSSRRSAPSSRPSGEPCVGWGRSTPVSAPRRRRSGHGDARCDGAGRPRARHMGLGRRQNAGVLALISFDAPSAPLLDRLCSEGVLPRLTELRATAATVPLSTPASHFPAGAYPTFGRVSHSRRTACTTRSCGMPHLSGSVQPTRFQRRRRSGSRSRRSGHSRSSSTRTRRAAPQPSKVCVSTGGSSGTVSCFAPGRHRRMRAASSSDGSAGRQQARRSSESLIRGDCGNWR